MKNLLSNVRHFINKRLSVIVVVSVVVLCAAFMIIGTRNADGSITLDGSSAKYTKAQEDALCDLSDKIDSAISELTGTNIVQDSGNGCAPTDIPQLGASVYYGVDVSTPAAFVNAVNGRGFNEGYGMQCVAGFKEFMYALSGKYVATSTGGASGYANQQSQIQPLGFTWHSGTAGMQDGDWAIFNTGIYGHVAMYYQGKWFGQNQGAANASVGSAFNLLSFGSNGVVGYYRPNIYQKAATSVPATSNSTSTKSSGSQPATISSSYTVQDGDTLGGISLGQGWWPSVAGLYGDSGYTQRLANGNGISNRGLIYPNQVIRRVP